MGPHKDENVPTIINQVLGTPWSIFSNLTQSSSGHSPMKSIGYFQTTANETERIRFRELCCDTLSFERNVI